MHFRLLVKFQEYGKKCWGLLNLIGALLWTSFGSESGLLLLWLYDDFETRLKKASTICFSGICKRPGWLWGYAGKVCHDPLWWGGKKKKRKKNWKMMSTAITGRRKQSVRERGKCGIPSKLRYGLAYRMVGKILAGYDHHSTFGLNLFKKKKEKEKQSWC